jgi:hypothetical protein
MLGAFNDAMDTFGELSGINGLARGVEQIAGGNVAGGAFTLAMSLPIGGPEFRMLPEAARVTTKASTAFAHVARFNGIPRWLASDRLHAIKRAAGLGGADNVLFDFSGGIWHSETREWLGSLTEGGARGWRP